MATIAAKISTRGLAKYVGKCVVCFAWSTRATRATKIAAKLSWARRELGHPLCSCCCSCSCISCCCCCSSVLRLLKIVALFSNSNSSSSWRTVQGANLSPPTSNVARLHKLISNLQRQQQQLQCASVMCRGGKGRGCEVGKIALPFG